jgi:hypothetical protein
LGRRKELAMSKSSSERSPVLEDWLVLAPFFGTGKQISVRGATIIDMQGDKISRNADYYDSATILREVGLLPPS